MELTREDLIQCLDALNASQERIARYKSMAAQDSYRELYNCLRCLRCDYLDALHESQKQLDQLDFVIYDLKHKI